MRREWTKEEVAYLEKFYETRGTDYIAKRLNRTIYSVRRKAQNLGYNAYLTEHLYMKTIASCFNCDLRVIHRWIDKYNLPAFIVKRGKLTCKLISVKDFWNWAETHKRLIPWHKYEVGSILPEPDWVKERVTACYCSNHRETITSEDIYAVVRMKQQGYTNPEIAEHLNRTVESIKHIWRNAKSDENISHEIPLTL